MLNALPIYITKYEKCDLQLYLKYIIDKGNVKIVFVDTILDRNLKLSW